MNRASFPGAGSSLRSVAGPEDALNESCGGDLQDELAPELDDNLGDNKRYEIFSFAKNACGVVDELVDKTRDYEWHIVWHIAINSSALSDEMWFFDRGSSGMYTHDPRRPSRTKELRVFKQQILCPDSVDAPES